MAERMGMTKTLVVTLLVVLAIPAAALATNVGNAKLTVHNPTHVGSGWVGTASLTTSKAEALELQVCIESNGRTVKQSCRVVHHTAAAVVGRTSVTHASNVRTWAWADVGAHTITAVS